MERPDDILIQNVLNNAAQPEDAKLVAQWFSTKEGSIYLQSLIDKDVEKLKSNQPVLFLHSGIEENEIYDKIEHKLRKKKISMILFRVAAVLIPLAFILFLTQKVNQQVDLFSNSSYNELFVPRGERQIFIFQDGTKAYINSESRLNYPEKFRLTSRKIDFEGEAYFVVEKNPHRPFIVDVSGLKVEVLGTSFNIKAYPQKDDIVVQLDEGSISLSTDKKEIIKLKPGYEAIYNKTSKSIQVTETILAETKTAWKNNVISFRNTPMSEVMETLARWYDVSFEVEDPRVYNYSYTLTTENILLEKLLLDLDKIAPVKFNMTDGKVTVSLK